MSNGQAYILPSIRKGECSMVGVLKLFLFDFVVVFVVVSHKPFGVQQTN